MLGKLLIAIGIVLIIIGLLMVYGEKTNFFGKLPGDLVIKRQNFTFYFPLMTSVVLSIVLTLVFFVIQKLK